MDDGLDGWIARWVTPAQAPTEVERWSIFDWIVGRRPEGTRAQRLRPVQLLRQSFTLTAQPTRATLRASARGIYTVELNGTAVGDEVLAPGYDTYEHRISVQTYDVTDAVRTGENVIGVTLADGWWAGRIGLTGSSAQWGAETSAVWQLETEYGDGADASIGSDASVRSAPGPWTWADLFIGERFDARAVTAGWSSPGFDDDGWSPVAASGEGLDVLVPFTGEPIRRLMELPARSVRGDADAGWVVDFGQVIAGRVRVTLPELPAGSEVVLDHTETLDRNGDWFANIDGINKDQQDVYVAAGRPGGETYEPTFTFHGFRYARIRGLAAPPGLADVAAVVIGSDLPQTGSFVASDARITRLHENVVWSQRGNFLAVPTDCPQRERAGWTGDIQIFVPAATNNADVRAFLGRWLDNLRADQLADGRIPIATPRSPFDAEAAASATGIGSIVAAAGWSDAIAIVPWVLYERYGDTRVLEQNYAAMLRWIEYQRVTAAAELPASIDASALTPERRARQALLYNTGEQFGDWLTPSTMAGKPLHEAIGIAPKLTGELVAPMFQANTLSLAAATATVLGHDADAADLASRADAVRAAVRDEYVTADGRMPVDLQGLYAIAIAFGIADGELRDAFGDRLAALVAENGDRLDTGFLSVPYLLDALWDTGHADVARRLLWQAEQPSWLYEVDHGATTIWESWDAIAPDGPPRTLSLNHYAFGCVDDWLYRRVAGITLEAPGYRAMRFEPDVDCGLTSVAAHIGSPHGRIGIRWRRAGDRVEIETDVPDGVDASLVIAGERVALTPGTTRTERAL